MRPTQPFIVKSRDPDYEEGDEIASVIHWQGPDGPLKIDVGGVILSPSEALRLSRWLVRASAEVKKDGGK